MIFSSHMSKWYFPFLSLLLHFDLIFFNFFYQSLALIFFLIYKLIYNGDSEFLWFLETNTSY